MKRLYLILIACFLVGCSKSEIAFQEDLQQRFDLANSLEVAQNNNRKDFYSYYIEPSIGKVKSNPSNNVFKKDGVDFIMNLNVSKIVSQKYYTDTLTIDDIGNTENLLFTLMGEYVDINKNKFTYICDVFEYDDLLMMFVRTEYMNFYTVGNETQLLQVADEILKIARTIEVHPNAIVSAYSSKEAIQYKKEALNLFEVSIPESGRVDEMISDTNGDLVDPGVDEGVDDIYQSDNFGDKVTTPTPQTDDYATDDFTPSEDVQ